MYNYHGCDAHTEKNIKKDCKKKQHFVAQVKNNQKALLDQIEFNSSIKEAKSISEYLTYDHNIHGRYEQRYAQVFDDLYGISKEWSMIKSIIKIQANVISYGKVTNELRYYVSDLQLNAKEFLHIIRSHWKIENSLHYIKDVSFEEDHSRIRTKQAPFIATMLRSIAINLFNLNKFSNIKQARKELGWSNYKIFSLGSKIN